MNTHDNKQWLKELTEEAFEESLNQPDLTELENELNAAIIAVKKPESDWDRIQAAKEANKEKNLTGHIRDFDFKTYLQTDQQAKDLMSTYLQNKGYTIDSTEETYKSDIQVSKDGKKSLFEVEITSVDFNKENWPWPKISFLARKKRYYEEEGNFHYVIISKNGEYAMTAQAKYIFKDENYMTKECSRNGITGIDEFYQLPKDQVKFFKLK